MRRRIFFRNLAFGAAGFYLIPAFSEGMVSNEVTGSDDLENGFFQPSGASLPWVMWYWMNGHVTKEGIILDLELLKRNGFRGAFIFHFNSGVPPGPAKQGSNEWLDVLEYAIREADRLGLELVLQFPGYVVGDEASVPPEYLLRQIAWSEITINAKGTVKVKLPVPQAPSKDYRDFKVLAYSGSSGEINMESVVDVTPLMNKKGILSWSPAAAENWTVVRIGWKTPEYEPLVDPMNEESLRVLTDNLKTMLLPRLSGKSFGGFFTTDTLLVNGWSKVTEEEYFTANEPDSRLPWLLQLGANKTVVSENSDLFRHDHRQFLKKKLEKNFFRGMEEWCRNQGLNWYVLPEKTIAGEPDTFWSSQQGMGELISDYKELSTGVVNGLYFAYDSPGSIRTIADSLFLSGWNQLIVSPFTHQPYRTGLPGMSPGFPGWAAGRNSTWSEHTAELTRYLGRTGFLLQQGTAVTDYVIFTGDLQDDTFFSERSFLTNEYSYGHLDPFALSRCGCEEGRIFHQSGQQFHVLMLIPGTQLYTDSLKKLAELTNSGMIILVVGKPVVRLTLSDDETVMGQLYEKLFGGWNGLSSMSREFGKGKVVFGASLHILLGEKNITPDLIITTEVKNIPVRFVHRKAGDTHFYFLRNESGLLAKINCSFRTGDLRPEIWNGGTGEIMPAPIFELTGDRCTMPLEIPARECVFVVFRKKTGISPLKKISVDRKQLWSNVPFANRNSALSSVENQVSRFENQDQALPVPFTFRTGKDGLLKALFILNGEYDFEINSENAEEHMFVYMTDCYSASLDSYWKISFPAGSGAPALYEPEELESLSLNRDFNIRHFSGICIYETVFYLSDPDFTNGRKCILDLGNVKVSARVIMNGKNAGFAWKYPYAVDFTPWAVKGENILKVEVAVPWLNRMVGDEQLPAENEYKNDGFIGKLPDWYVANQPKPGERITFLVRKVISGDEKLKDSGLLGPVKIIFAEERSI